jgi:glutathione-specific gamma-glutamylcyclotransferase
MKERQAAAEKFLEESQDWQRAEEVINSEFEDSDMYTEDEEEQGSNLSDADQGADDLEEEEEELDEDPSTWACVACDKYFQSEAAWLNHEKSKKHKQEVKRLKREMQADEAEFGFAAQGAVEEGDDLGDASAGIPLPNPWSASTKKAKKKQRKQQKAQQALDGDPEQLDDPEEERLNLKPALSAALDEDAARRIHASVVGTATPEVEMGPPPTRPPGSFDVFGYGSLIFKPPPHAIGRTPGFIKGFARRFAQHSIDHRGTPERPGRVVTLISAADWHSFAKADDAPEGDIVWGYSYTIDPAHAVEVKAYLDWREKNGYTEQRVTVWKSETEVVVEDALVYVGLPDNEAFVGPSDMDELALRIYTCEGPSGRNDEYLLNLAEAVRKLAPQVKDSYLFKLEEKVLALKASTAEAEGKAQNGGGVGNHAAEEGKKARKQQKKEAGKQKGKNAEVSLVIGLRTVGTGAW